MGRRRCSGFPRAINPISRQSRLYLRAAFGLRPAFPGLQTRELSHFQSSPAWLTISTMKRPKVDQINKKPPREAEAVFDAIHTIMHLFRSQQYRVLRGSPYEITHLEGKLLGFFARHPGATLRDLVAHSGRDKGQLARLIRSLREQGILQGEGDEGDRRSVRLRLTPEGLRIHETLRKQVGRLSDRAVDGLSAEERSQLVDLLMRVQANLEPDTCCAERRGR